MIDIAMHVRIFAPEPTDELVDKRTAAIGGLSARFGKRRGAIEVLQLANGAAVGVAPKGTLPSELACEAEEAIKEQSTSFVRAGHELEILVCTLVALLFQVQDQKPSTGPISRADVLASGLWSALSFQPVRPDPKIEALRAKLIAASETQFGASAEGARRRAKVPDFAVAVAEGGDFAQFNKAFKPGTEKTIDALRSNAALDREELDLLWWALGDRSELLDQTFSSMPAEVSAVTSCMEVGRMLRKLPAKAHNHLALRNVESTRMLDLSELVESLGERRSTLMTAAQLDREKLEKCPAVFPLLSALLSGKAASTGSRRKRPLREWGSRALLETSILSVVFNDRTT